MDAHGIQRVIADLLPKAEQFLCDLMRFPSTSGNEHEAMLFLEKEFGSLNAAVERVPMSNALRSDSDYSTPIPDLQYDGRFNLRILRQGGKPGPKLLFNAHTDVVPPSEGMDAPWSPRVEEGKVWGRGACDDKGPLACLLLTLKVLDVLNPDLCGQVAAHLVCEEENGGNGSLAMARTGEQADACIVLEPTDHKVFTSIRGAVWFRVTFKGKAGHSGQAGQTRSALLMARDAMAALEAYHADLLASSRGHLLFDPYPNPMPITFGHLTAGNWPASAPNLAVLEGVLGLLPNKTKEEVCAEMRQALVEGSANLAPEDFDLCFTYRHDSSVIEPTHPFPQGLLRAAECAGAPASIDGMTASCDAWFYNNQLGIPTVVYGPGTLKVAHSVGEHIAMNDIARTAAVFVAFILDYCGGKET
jgi:acetylornithine deacetylase